MFEKFDLYFTDFRKAIACLPDPHWANLDRLCRICGNLLGKKALAKEKYITQLNNVLFINITKDLQYYILLRYASDAVVL